MNAELSGGNLLRENCGIDRVFFLGGGFDGFFTKQSGKRRFKSFTFAENMILFWNWDTP